MKIVVLLFLLALHSSAQESITVGAGMYTQTQPYKNVDAIITPTPVVFYDNSLFYVRWTRIGMYFMGQSSDTFSWGASLTAQPRPLGYKEKSESSVEGMDQRQGSFEGGVALSCKYTFKNKNNIFAEILNLHDMMQRNNGYIVRAEVGSKILYDKWSFYPSLLAIYHSENFNNYYYGVKESETNNFRQAFNVSSGTDYAAQTYINYEITSKYSLLFYTRLDKLSSQITASPIVTDEHFYSSMLSLIYTFKY